MARLRDVKIDTKKRKELFYKDLIEFVKQDELGLDTLSMSERMSVIRAMAILMRLFKILE